VIYYCIPAYNEASTVGVLLWKIKRVMEDFPRDYEIIVLDDGSTDETLDVLAPYARVLPLTVIRQDDRRGYAASMERLIREAVSRASHPRRDVMVMLQADFTDAPEDIPGLVKRIEGGADVVEAVSVNEGGTMPASLRLARRGLPWLLRRAHLPEGVRDPASGFRAYRVSVLKRALADGNGKPLLSRDGMAANVELLLAVSPHARRTDGYEVERRYDLRQRDSRFRPWSTLVELWSVARQARRGSAGPAASEIST
jgi:glycosyltransferase involved in cell wall biosynthesis